MLGRLVAVASLVAEHRLQGVQGSGLVARGLWSAGSAVGAHGLSCSMACGIFPEQGSNQCPLALQDGFLTTGPPGKPCFSFEWRQRCLRLWWWW